MKVRSDICNECPFRRRALPGYLGSNEPMNFAFLALSDQSLACHTMMDQTLPLAKWREVEAGTTRCRGAIIFQRNCLKLSCDKELAAVKADHIAVFSNVEEFFRYHNSARIKSWTFD